MRTFSLHTGKPVGFTLIEVLMATALAGIILTGIIKTFIDQNDSYNVQIKIAALQQNLRVAMNILTRDILMAGYFTSIDRRMYPNCVDWNPYTKGKESLLPYMQGVDNIIGVPNYRDGADSIVIVKAGDDIGCLGAGEKAAQADDVIALGDPDLNKDGYDDLNSGGSRFGILVKADLTQGQLFEIVQIEKNVVQNAKPGKAALATVKYPFLTSYSESDIIARADIIIYRVDDANKNFSRSVLERKNVGNGDHFQVVAEDIVDLQCSYILDDGTETNDPTGDECSIRAVSVDLAGEVDIPRKGKISRRLRSVVSVRNAPK